MTVKQQQRRHQQQQQNHHQNNNNNNNNNSSNNHHDSLASLSLSDVFARGVQAANAARTRKTNGSKDVTKTTTTTAASSKCIVLEKNGLLSRSTSTSAPALPGGSFASSKTNHIGNSGHVLPSSLPVPAERSDSQPNDLPPPPPPPLVKSPILALQRAASKMSLRDLLKRDWISNDASCARRGSFPREVVERTDSTSVCFDDIRWAQQPHVVKPPVLARAESAPVAAVTTLHHSTEFDPFEQSGTFLDKQQQAASRKHRLNRSKHLEASADSSFFPSRYVGTTTTTTLATVWPPQGSVGAAASASTHIITRGLVKVRAPNTDEATTAPQSGRSSSRRRQQQQRRRRRAPSSKAKRDGTTNQLTDSKKKQSQQSSMIDAGYSTSTTIEYSSNSMSSNFSMHPNEQQPQDSSLELTVSPPRSSTNKFLERKNMALAALNLSPARQRRGSLQSNASLERHHHSRQRRLSKLDQGVKPNGPGGSRTHARTASCERQTTKAESKRTEAAETAKAAAAAIPREKRGSSSSNVTVNSHTVNSSTYADDNVKRNHASISSLPEKPVSGMRGRTGALPSSSHAASSIRNVGPSSKVTGRPEASSSHGLDALRNKDDSRGDNDTPSRHERRCLSRRSSVKSEKDGSKHQRRLVAEPCTRGSNRGRRLRQPSCRQKSRDKVLTEHITRRVVDLYLNIALQEAESIVKSLQNSCGVQSIEEAEESVAQQLGNLRMKAEQLRGTNAPSLKEGCTSEKDGSTGLGSLARVNRTKMDKSEPNISSCVKSPAGRRALVQKSDGKADSIHLSQTRPISSISAKQLTPTQISPGAKTSIPQSGDDQTKVSSRVAADKFLTAEDMFAELDVLASDSDDDSDSSDDDDDDEACNDDRSASSTKSSASAAEWEQSKFRRMSFDTLAFPVQHKAKRLPIQLTESNVSPGQKMRQSEEVAMMQPSPAISMATLSKQSAKRDEALAEHICRQAMNQYRDDALTNVRKPTGASSAPGKRSAHHQQQQAISSESKRLEKVPISPVSVNGHLRQVEDPNFDHSSTKMSYDDFLQSRGVSPAPSKGKRSKKTAEEKSGNWAFSAAQKFVRL